MRRMVVIAVMVLAGLVVALPLLLVERAVEVARGDEAMIRVYLHEEERTVEMSVTDYLIGALAAEMPASFEEESLRAGAVAERTYAFRHMRCYGGTGYRDADISTDYRIHQAYSTEKALREKWGSDYDHYYEKLSRAVKSTAGEVITYQGKLIEAFYHSMCGGRTASSQEVWDTPRDYLVSVDCSWDRDAPRYRDRRAVTFAELSSLLGEGVMTAPVNGDGSEVIRVVNRTESGRADLVRIGERNYAGTDLRQKLGLRSANFTTETGQDGIVFTTVGYGHGVGLCQYGANGMARAGYGYRDILRHYYQGVTVERMK